MATTNAAGLIGKPEVFSDVEVLRMNDVKTLQVRGQSATATPSANRSDAAVLFFDTANSGALSKKDSNGTVTAIEGAGLTVSDDRYYGRVPIGASFQYTTALAALQAGETRLFIVENVTETQPLGAAGGHVDILIASGITWSWNDTAYGSGEGSLRIAGEAAPHGSNATDSRWVVTNTTLTGPIISFPGGGGFNSRIILENLVFDDSSTIDHSSPASAVLNAHYIEIRGVEWLVGDVQFAGMLGIDDYKISIENSTITGRYTANRGRWLYVRPNLPGTARCILQNVTINGTWGTSAGNECLMLGDTLVGGTGAEFAEITNLRIENTASVAHFFFAGAVVDNVDDKSGIANQITLGNGLFNNIRSPQATVRLHSLVSAVGGTKITAPVLSNSQFAGWGASLYGPGTSNASFSQISNCTFTGDVTTSGDDRNVTMTGCHLYGANYVFNGDRCIWTGCLFGTGTDAGAGGGGYVVAGDNNIIVACLTDRVFTLTGAGNVVANNFQY